MVKGLLHAGLSTRDMEKSLWFYCQMLGGNVILEVEEPRGTPWIQCVRFPDGTCIELFYPRADYPLGDKLGRSHCCFAVENMEEVASRLEEYQVEITQPPRTARDGNRQMWCKDPNGYPVEFVELMPGSPQTTHGPKVTLY